jgi:hypothetical protein
MKKPDRAIILLSLLYLSVLISGCNNIEFISNWRDREINIDGYDTEWHGSLLSLEKGKMALGICNDKEYLYICSVVSDREIKRQTMRLGLTVWFDADGGADKSFGINFPIGMQGERLPMIERRESGGSFDEEQLFQQMTGEMEIIGPEKDERFKTLAPGTNGIEARLSHSDGRLVYELKIPLAINAQHSYAIKTYTGKEIGIGLEVTAPNMDKIKERKGKNGMPGRGGTPPVGMQGGGERPRGGSSMQETLKLWATVKLASAATGVAK